MSIGEIIFIVAVVGVAILLTVLKEKVPAWLGFVLMLAACLVVVVGSAVTKNFKAIPIGAAGALATIVAWVSVAVSKAATNPDLPDDGTSTRRDDPDTLGGVTSNIRWWAWMIIVVLVVGAVAVTFAMPHGAA